MAMEKWVKVRNLMLDARDKEILHMYQSQHLTQQKIAEKYGISRQRIGKILKKGKL